MSKGGGGGEVEGVYWFSVKYGEDQTAIFNSDCWAQARTLPMAYVDALQVIAG